MTSAICMQRSYETETFKNLLKRLHGLTPDQAEALMQSAQDITAQNAALCSDGLSAYARFAQASGISHFVLAPNRALAK